MLALIASALGSKRASKVFHSRNVDSFSHHAISLIVIRRAAIAQSKVRQRVEVYIEGVSLLL
jgi:hypothetical protein